MKLVDTIILAIKRFGIRVLEEFGRKYRYVSIFDYVLEHPDKAQFLSLKTEKTVYTEAVSYIPSSYKQEIKSGIDLFDWLVVIKNAKCFSDTDLVITSEGDALYDIKKYKSISQYGDYLYGVIIHDNPKYCQVRRHKSITLESAFLLEGLWSWNWYHFVTQILPKIKNISLVPSNVPILVGAFAQGDNNFHTILHYFISQYAPNREVIYMNYSRAYLVKELYMSSCQGLLLPDMNKNCHESPHPEWCLYKTSTINFLRETLLREKDTKKTYPEKFYISRKNASKRRKFNEEEVIALMQSLGFAIVAPEEYTVSEQIALFNNAKCIVACSGAALTNLLYCQKGCKVIILNNYLLKIGIYNTIAAVLGLECISISGFDNEPIGDHIQDTFVINPQKIKKAMRILKMDNVDN